MLASQKLKAFIPTLNQGRAKAFYQDLLGLKLISEDNFALEFVVNGAPLRITNVQQLVPHPFTVLGWDVQNMHDVIEALVSKGIKFEKYDFLIQDDHGVWVAPGGTKVAWFKDPDGNLLSLSE